MSAATTNSISNNSTAAPSSTRTDPTMTVATLLQLGICLPGLMINSLLVFVVLRNRQLRTSCCSMLILLLAICDCLAEFSLITVTSVFYLAGITVPLLTCFYLLCYSPFAALSAGMLMLLIGVDRLWAVIFPLIYKVVSIEHKWKYMFLFLAVPSVPIVFVLYQYYLYSSSQASKQVFCSPGDLVGPAAISYAFQLYLFCNIGTFLVYAIIWLLFKLKIVKLVQSSVEQRLLRSLYILIVVNFFCWLPPSVFGTYLLPYISPDFQTQLTVNRLVQQLNKLAQALNGVVLFVYSFEYRSAMQQELHLLFRKLFRRSNQISDNNNNDNRNNQNNINVNAGINAPQASRLHQRISALWNSSNC